MTTKFKKSNIQIGGKLAINIHHPQEGFKLCWNEEKIILLTGLNQSKSGVYCLRNKLNGRLYIGMARNLEVRRDRHFRDLMKGIHCSDKLQDDFDNYFLANGHGETDPKVFLEFEVIIYCYPSQLTFWEGILIDNLKPYYNIKKKKEI